MTKRTSILLASLGSLIVIVVVGAAVLVVHGTALDRESRQYVDEVLPAIAKSWDAAEIKRNMSPEGRAAVTDDDIDKIASGAYQKLGRLISYEGAKGQAVISVNQQGKRISAQYIAHATFEKGPADLKVFLIKHGDQWALLGMDIRWPL